MEFESILKRCLPREAPLPTYDWNSVNLPFFEIGNRYHLAKVIVVRRDGRLVPSLFEGVRFPEPLTRFFDVSSTVRPKANIEGNRFLRELTTKELIEVVKSSPNHIVTFRENALRLALIASRPPRRLPKKLDANTLGRIKYWTKRGASKAEIARKVGVSRPTLYSAYERIREIDAERLMDAYKSEVEKGSQSVLGSVISDKAWKYALAVCSHKDPLYSEYTGSFHQMTMWPIQSPKFRSVYYRRLKELQTNVKSNIRGFNL